MSRIFTCAGCHAALTGPLRALPAALGAGRRNDGCNEVAGSCFVVDPERDRPDHPVTINPGDARGVRLHPDLERAHGCCGLAYMNGLANLCCTCCGAEVGMVMADGDHGPHCVHLRDHGPEVPGGGPSDAQLLARITCLGELVAATPWSTMFPPALTGDDRWIDDVDTVATRLPRLEPERSLPIHSRRRQPSLIWYTTVRISACPPATSPRRRRSPSRPTPLGIPTSTT